MIDPEKLRKRLDEVWAELGRQADTSGHEVMRACALTLITVVDEDDSPDDTSLAIAELMREHPSRAILVRVGTGEEELLEAGVDARCWMPFGGRQQICSEQIVIRCSEKSLGDVPGVILPLVVADLPVVLWCPSRRACRSDAFAQLTAPAGRIIVDTRRAPGAFEEAAKLGRHALIGDLSWTRLTRWRALLAQVFENELYRRHVPYFSGITVYYEGEQVPPAALLMAGWLTSRLRWEEERLRTGLRFVHLEGQAGMPVLRGFVLVSEHEPAMRISIFRVGTKCGEVRVDVAGLEPVMNRVALAPSTDLLLLGEELAIHSRDPVFEESREWAARIARTLSAS